MWCAAKTHVHGSGEHEWCTLLSTLPWSHPPPCMMGHPPVIHFNINLGSSLGFCWHSKCWFIFTKFITKDRIKIACESFSWIQCLLAEKNRKTTVTVFQQDYQIHLRLARWQRVPTASLAAAFENRHQPSEILRNDSCMNQLYKPKETLSQNSL